MNQGDQESKKVCIFYAFSKFHSIASISQKCIGNISFFLFFSEKRGLKKCDSCLKRHDPELIHKRMVAKALLSSMRDGIPITKETAALVFDQEKLTTEFLYIGENLLLVTVYDPVKNKIISREEIALEKGHENSIIVEHD